MLAGGGGAPAIPFRADQLSPEVMYHAPWEGGSEPEDLTIYAQNSGATNGTGLTRLTDWSGNARHAVSFLGSASFVEASVGTAYGYRSTGSASFGINEISELLFGSSTDLTVVIVYNNTGSGTLFGSQTAANAATTPAIIDRSLGDVDWNSGADSFDFANPLSADSNVLLHTQDASDAFGYLNGTQVYSKGGAPVSIPAGTTLARLFSAGTGSSRFSGNIGFFGVWFRKLTDTERDNLTAWLGDQFGITVAAGFEIASPVSRSVYQIQDDGTGLVRASGPLRGATSLQARWNGGAWNNCTIISGSWSVAIPSDVGRGDLEVRTPDGSRLASVPNVIVGRKIAGWGQSNMFGSAENFDDLSSNLDIALFDPRPSPQPPMFGSLPRNQWNPASDKSCWPRYLEVRAANDLIPWGFVRFAIGSTKIAFWEPDAGPDPAGFGYTGIEYLNTFINAVIEAEGHNPQTYDPDTDGICCEEVFMQIGETDAQAGTTKAAFKSSMVAIARYIRLRLGVPMRCSILQNLPVPSYVPVASQLEAIQDAVSEAVSEELILAGNEGRDPDILLGPDFSGVTLADPPGDGIHWYTDAERDSQGESWAAWPIESQLIYDESGDIVVDEGGNAIYTETVV